MGSLGSGNHFLEVQAVDQVADAAAARSLGLSEGLVCVMISGSQGLGHQICTDHLRRMESAMHRYGIQVADRQLACVPVRSPEGEAYLAAMAAAAGYGQPAASCWPWRPGGRSQPPAGRTVSSWSMTCRTTWPSRRHDVDGRPRQLCVHRKGATRAPPGHPELPPDLAGVGQPVLVPGSMGTASHVLVGVSGAARSTPPVTAPVGP